MDKTRVLIVEDEFVTASDIKTCLEESGYIVSAIVPSGEKAIASVIEDPPDIILMDILLKSKMSGIDAADTIRSRYNLPVIFLTAHSDEQILEKAKLTEPFGYILKPFQVRELHGTIEVALYKHKVERDLKVRTRQQSIVAELGKKALSGAEISSLSDDLVKLTAQGLDVEYCKVLELSPDGDSLLLKYGVGWKEGLVGHATVGSGKNSQAGYTLLSDKPVIVEEFQKETRFSGPQLLTDHGVISGISVIISGKLKPYGVLGAHTPKRRKFTQDDINFLQSVSNLLTDAIDRKQAEDALLRKTHDLGERVKELNCLYSISKVIERLDISTEDMFQGVVNIIPPSWQYPEITCARIRIGNEAYITKNFQETTWRQTSNIVVQGEQIGEVDVFYLEEMPEIAEGPFLMEERHLIDEIVIRLAMVAERKKAEEQLKKLNQELLEKEELKTTLAMATTINHEINNPLTGVIGYTESLLSEEDLSEENKKELKIVWEEANRIAEVVKRFSKITKPVMTKYIGDMEMVDLKKSEYKEED